ncbi:hypothetical protein DPMN_100380 [Dreissena polymorpha]|uniref:Uncharacterized protein n=1 Tax=Dreissena polymorpha TaxID=45954 RepID=A0A9D4LFV3_DREPO|nr:hypothetical protein DPMN_100380 [Dreissena polymorpha]
MQADYPNGVLNDLNNVLRKEVRTWLKLPDSSMKVCFYESTGKGGLGLPQFSLNAPEARDNTLRRVA